MKRINIYIGDTEFEHLKKLPGTLSEHIRLALYRYLLGMAKVSASNSKEGEAYGK